MQSNELKTFLNKNKMSQGDLCKLLWDTATTNDRNIISRWVNGSTKPPRYLKKFLLVCIEYNILKKSD